MNKKNLLAYTVIVVLVLISFLGGTTFAKYLTEHSTSASLKVAKWAVTENFLVNGSSTTSESINLAKTYNPETLSNEKIAPGTSGSFGVEIDASGTETGVIYQVEFDNITGTKPENLEFTYNNNKYSDLTKLSKALTGTIAANADTKVLNLEIEWSWVYDSLNANKIDTRDTQDTLDRSNNF